MVRRAANRERDGLTSEATDGARGAIAEDREDHVERRKDVTLPLVTRMRQLLEEAEEGWAHGGRLAKIKNTELTRREMSNDHQHAIDFVQALWWLAAELIRDDL